MRVLRDEDYCGGGNGYLCRVYVLSCVCIARRGTHLYNL